MKVIIALVVMVAAAEAVKLRFRPVSAADTASSGSSPAWCKNLDCPTFKVLQKTKVRTKESLVPLGTLKDNLPSLTLCAQWVATCKD